MKKHRPFWAPWGGPIVMGVLTTTGFGDIAPVSDRARLVEAVIVTPIRFAVIFIFVGTAYNFLIKKSWETWRMARIQERLTGHTVALGFGVERQLQKNRQPGNAGVQVGQRAEGDRLARLGDRQRGGAGRGADEHIAHVVFVGSDAQITDERRKRKARGPNVRRVPVPAHLSDRARRRRHGEGGWCRAGDVPRPGARGLHCA